MKADYIYSLIAMAIAALLTWGCYTMTDTEELKILVAVMSFISLSASGLCSIALTFGESRSSVVIRATSAVFFFVLLLLNGGFTFFNFSKPLYIICNGLILLLMCIIVRAVARSRM